MTLPNTFSLLQIHHYWLPAWLIVVFTKSQ